MALKEGSRSVSYFMDVLFRPDLYTSAIAFLSLQTRWVEVG